MLEITNFERIDRSGVVLRIAITAGERWLVATDLCRAMEYTNTSAVLKRLPDAVHVKALSPEQRVISLVTSEGAKMILTGGITKKMGSEFTAWLIQALKNPGRCSHIAGVNHKP